MPGALTILIIRHAEKPTDGGAGPGFTDTGVQDDKSLTIRGWQRAGAWAALFGARLGGSDFPAPQKVYAAQRGSGAPDEGPSNRPYETALPLACRLRSDPIETWKQDEEAKLVKHVVAETGVVLVSWEHKAIVSAILPRIPIGNGKAPTHWPGERFGAVVRLDRAEGEDTFDCRMLYPRLLCGDTAEPFPGTS